MNGHAENLEAGVNSLAVSPKQQDRKEQRQQQQQENPTDPLNYDKLHESADHILINTAYRPKVAIICGSGLGGLGDLVVKPDVFPYTEIPHFPVSTVSGHAGRILIGELNGVEVLVMQGRFHSYEGYQLWQTALPVRVMKLVGIEFLLVTNAAGGINKAFEVGDMMVLRDHINLPGFACEHPLRGLNDSRFGSRFFPCHKVYSDEARKLAVKIGEECGLTGFQREGVYAMTGGPNFETDAEVHLLRSWGVDAVGMSTIPEILVAHHCGIQVFACSLITNKCGEETNHDEVLQIASQRSEDMKSFIARMVTAVSTDILKPSSDIPNK